MSLWEYFQKRSVEVGVGYVLNLDGNISWPKSLDEVKEKANRVLAFPSSALWPPIMWTFPPCAVKDSLWNHVLLHQGKKSQGIPITMSTPCTSWSLPSPNKRSQGFLGEGMPDSQRRAAKGSLRPKCPVLGRRESSQVMGLCKKWFRSHFNTHSQI